jgi:thymidylate synthase (FAD)
MTEKLVTEDHLVPPGASVVLPPYGFVRLQKHCASDLDVVDAARVSFAQESQWEEGDEKVIGGPELQLKKDDEGVLRYLMRSGHGTPFEHNFFKFHVRAPIFVFREWHRHRIGVSINEESARYSKLQPHFYIPERDDVRSQQGKPGAYTFEREPDDDKAEQFRKILHEYSTRNYGMYEAALSSGMAKEIARLFLPVNIYSQMIWCCNARSLMAFLHLRNHDAAQREIRKYASAMEDMFAKVMPVTHDAFLKNERRAP